MTRHRARGRYRGKSGIGLSPPTDSESDSDFLSDTLSDSMLGSASDSEIESDQESNSNSDSDFGVEFASEIGSDSGLASEILSDAEAASAAASELRSESLSDSASDEQSDADSDFANASDIASDQDSDSEVFSELESEFASASESASDSALISELESEILSELQSRADSESGSASDSEDQSSESASGSASDSVLESELDSASASDSEDQSSESASDSVLGSEADSDSEDQSSESASDSASGSASDSAFDSESASDSEDQSSESASDSASDSALDSEIASDAESDSDNPPEDDEMKNLLVNAAGLINQRQSSTVADTVYALDHWYALTQTAVLGCISATDIENGFPHAALVVQEQASAQRIGLAQIIESDRCRAMRGEQITLSGRVKASANMTLRYAIVEWTGSRDAPVKELVADWTSGTYTEGNFFVSSASLSILGVGSIALTAATTAALTPLTVTVGSGMNNLTVFLWSEGTMAQNANFQFRAQLEKGAAETAFAHRSFVDELEDCLSWYEKTFNYLTVPAQNAGVDRSLCSVSMNNSSGTNYYSARWVFAKPKIATPVIVTFNPSAANANWRNIVSGVDGTVANVSANNFAAHVEGTNPTTNGVMALGRIHATAEASLGV